MSKKINYNEEKKIIKGEMEIKAEDVVIYYDRHKSELAELIRNKDIVSLVRLLNDIIEWFDKESNVLYYKHNPFCSQNFILLISQIPVLYRVEFVGRLLKNTDYEIIFMKNELFDPVPKKMNKK